MKHFGDITKLNGTELPIVDIITGGSPCQDLSVAGKRAGLAGERSGLFMDQIRIIKEMRDEDKRRRCGITVADEYIRPRYMVWENVPGAFSSNKGEDFRAVLEETAKVADKDAYVPGLEGGKWSPCGCILGDGWSIAWRLHDSQWWGVPQRRKRICLLADFNGDTAGRILFELQRKTPESDTEQAIVDIGTEPGPEVQSVSKGVPGNIAESREEGQRIAEDTERCAGETSTEQIVALTTEITPKIDDGVAFSLHSRDYKDPQSVCCFEPGTMSRVGGHAYEDVAGTVRANAGDNQQAVVYGIGSYDSNAMKSDNPKSGIYHADTSRTLDINGGNPGCNQGGMAIVQSAGVDTYNQTIDEELAQPLRAADGGDSTPKVVAFTQNQRNEVRDLGEKAGALAAERGVHQQTYVLEGNGSRPLHRGDGYSESETMYTLNSTEHHAVAVENHPADSRVKIADDGVVQTLSGRMGTGGGNVPLVMESQTFSDVASTRSAADCTKGVHSQMMKNPEENFVLEPVAMASKQISQNIGENIGMTLCGNDYKEPQCVAYGLDRASFNQGMNAKYDFSVDEEKVGTCVAKGPNAVCKNGGIYAGTQNKVLCLLSKTYGEETVEKWGIAILAALQSSEILQSGVHESSVSSETENRHKLDGGSLPCPSIVAGWLLRDMRKQQECGCSPHRRQSTEQQPEKSEKGMPELSQQNPQNCKDLFDMWEKGEGLWLLREALSEIQEVRQSFNGKGQSVHGCSIVRRLTPLEAERLQGFPDHWTDIGDWIDSKGKKHKDADSPRYKALGNSIALPFWEWMAKRMVEKLKEEGVEEPTMASLFDGIGGFPLVYQRAGCKPVWASEIEEFPIAVTKRRFPDDFDWSIL